MVCASVYVGLLGSGYDAATSAGAEAFCACADVYVSGEVCYA